MLNLGPHVLRGLSATPERNYSGNGGTDVFVFRADLAVDRGFGHDTITDFDPLAALRTTPQGAVLDVSSGPGGGVSGATSSVLFLGRLITEFSADDFQVI